MVQYSNQPEKDDLVLGGQTSTPPQGVVLGGLEGVRWHLKSSVASQRVAALYQALKYGEAGLDLVIQALSIRSWQVQKAALSILKGRTEPRVQQALLEHNPYRLMNCLATLNGHASSVLAVTLAPDGQTLASSDEAETIKIWHLKTGQEIHALSNHPQEVNCIAWGRDRDTIAIAGKHICLWNLSTGQLTRTFSEAAKVNSLVFSQDGQTLLSGCEDGKIGIYNLTKGRISTLRDSQSVSCLALSLDEQTLFSGGEDIKGWDCKTGREICALKEHKYGVNCLTISPDGQTLFSGSNDYTIKVWDLRGQLIRTLNGHDSSVLSLVVSPDGQTLLSSSGDKTIKVWDLRTRKVIHTLSGHTGWVNTLALSFDGEILVSGGSDGIKIWGLNC